MTLMTWCPRQLTSQQQEARRLDCAERFATGDWTILRLSQYYRVARSTILAWKQKWKKGGMEGLRTKKAPGPVAQLTNDQRQELKSWILQDATVHGFPDSTWTSRRVRDLIGLKFGVWYHPDHVYKILKRLQLSYQRPDKRAIERNEERIAEWKSITLPDLQKQRSEGTTLVFLDESGFSLKTTVQRTWGLRGQTPLIRTRMNWEKVSVIGCITSGGKFFQHTVMGACKGVKVAQFLQHLLKHVSGEIIVVLDNAGIHKGKAVQQVLQEVSRLRLVFLPPYAPELNPMEYVWAWVKCRALGNRLCRSIQELKVRLRLAWHKVRRLDLKAFMSSGLWSEGPCRPQ